LAIACGIGLLVCASIIKLPNPTAQNTRARRKSFSTRNEEPESGMLLADGNDEEDGDASDADITVDSAILPAGVEVEASAEVTGWALLGHLDFCLLLAIVGLREFLLLSQPALMIVSGCGLMWINNLGNNLVALYRAEVDSRADMDPRVLERLQAANVSVLSILNCAGRIFGGVTSDILKAKIRLQRPAFLLLSSFIFVLVMIFAYHNTSSGNLIYYTTLLGFAYGTMFGVGPVITSECFGLKGFSFNWGLVSVAPGLMGNIANLLYGYIYDSHSDPETHECDLGVRCYRDAFIVMAFGCSFALVCALTLFLRHTREARLKTAHR
jgi:MFS family permease